MAATYLFSHQEDGPTTVLRQSRLKFYTYSSLVPTQVFDLGATMGFAMSTLDIGGGFGGSLGPDGHANLCGMPAAINAALDRWFPAESNVTILAEPGRFFAEAPSTLACAGMHQSPIGLGPNISVCGLMCILSWGYKQKSGEKRT